MPTEPSQTPSVTELLPQNVRLTNARGIVAQALTAATVSYQLTIQEQVLLIESLLSDARGSLLAFTTAQYERAAMPGETAPEPPA